MEKIRSFVAIELPREIQMELTSLEDKLKAGRHPFVKWVDPKGVHLTLKFLGSVASDRIPKIVEALVGVAQETTPFTIEVGELGAFPSLQRPQVIWVGLRGEIDRLSTLQKGVDTVLAPLGFAPESRSFAPHLTLARLREGVSSSERQEFSKSVAATRHEVGVSFRVDALNLMKSQLTPAGAIYSCLASIKLRE